MVPSSPRKNLLVLLLVLATSISSATFRGVKTREENHQEERSLGILNNLAYVQGEFMASDLNSGKKDKGSGDLGIVDGDDDDNTPEGKKTYVIGKKGTLFGKKGEYCEEEVDDEDLGDDEDPGFSGDEDFDFSNDDSRVPSTSAPATTQTPPPLPPPTSPPFLPPTIAPVLPPTAPPISLPIPAPTPPPVLPSTSPVPAPTTSGSFQCDFSQTISFKCGNSIFICQDENQVVSADPSKGVCNQQPSQNSEFIWIDPTSQLDATVCDILTTGRLGVSVFVPPPVCYCAHMRKAVEVGGFGSGFPEEIKCAPGSNGNSNAISNYACYFSTTIDSPILSDPQKEDADGSVGNCNGYTPAIPLLIIDVV
ncbi:hypothetical protein IV203_017813 [Nitzschia inconspicua]|uniref:Uncharacterized protein n=1 Tax=Nitzschia inconspicua TaxID=303405 RepID=A0A9K3M0J3_9STRA|nr:hypothetical protein IV203_017813 [Nitzschia inconspicua]